MRGSIIILCVGVLTTLGTAFTAANAAQMKDFLGVWIPQGDSCSATKDGGEYQGFTIKKNDLECGWGCVCDGFKAKIAGDKLSIAALCTAEEEGKAKITISATFLKPHQIMLGFDDVAPEIYKYCSGN
ncbi:MULTISPECIES: hypothetical protein [unclassified Mesorhizobium]|uniref:hypothetical protein n=1 Tax=unclassified Mesorhizobium TaxID=325217 RepID=UPI001CC9F09E|nr:MULTISPECIES: hypothetical protein [unclassified Mesorhizobium]MBZ9741024.1 hypothetical protein [Mesorhizobium sp. CO1-1-4]MBZ9804367.1 hypothetical protein [Mesorhizobium sp. ES1-6]